MPVNFAGPNPNNIHIARSGAVLYSSAGFAYAHATEGGKFGLRMDTDLEFKPGEVKDWAKRPNMNAHMVTATLPHLETTLKRIKNVHLLSKGPANYQFQSAEGEYFNFNPTTNNDYVNPNGSEMLGSTYSLKIDQKTRTLTSKLVGEIFSSQRNWIEANTGTNVSGGSGGTALGLTAWGGEDDTQYVESNWVYVLINGFNVGILGEGTSLELDSTGPTDNRKRPYCNKLGVKLKIDLLQSSPTELQAAMTACAGQLNITLQSCFNEQWNFINGSTKGLPSFSFGDKKRAIEIDVAGEVPFTQVTYDNSAKIATFDLLGV